MWAIHYDDRRCRLYYDYVAACRFFNSNPLARSMWWLRAGTWDSIAWRAAAGREN